MYSLEVKVENRWQDTKMRAFNINVLREIAEEADGDYRILDSNTTLYVLVREKHVINKNSLEYL